MKQAKHAQNIANRFKEIVEQSGDEIKQEHIDELSLLIESGLDSALIEQLERVSDKLNALAQSIRREAEGDDN